MKWPDLPKRVAISAAVIVGFVVLFLVLFFTLGSARDGAVAANQNLKADLDATERNLQQTAADRAFVAENTARYERLMAGTKMVPHARRAAVVQLQQLARASGLTTLNFNFQAAGGMSPAAAAAQPQAGGFRVNVEQVELNLGAPLDGMIYRFVAALTTDFPGSIVLQSIELDRAPAITADNLNLVARGQEANIVKGRAMISWRTAQRTEPQDVAAAGQR